ncbi:MAG TPA: HlyD family secretion protein [Thermoanaerobaculia bacterium]|nr:HlyD family secretion protein [Thermoanaerobaculia bacterium]
MQREQTAVAPAPAPVPPASEVAEHEPVIKPERAKRIYWIIGIVVAVLLIGYGVYSLVMSGKESTDDAGVAADVVPVSARIAGQVVNVYIQENQQVHKGDRIADIDPSDAQVKVEQAQADLQSAIAAAADADARVAVARASATGGYTAAQGAVQASKQAADVSSDAIRQAEAQVKSAEANATKARLDYERAEELGGKGDISKSQVDAARAANETAQAALAQARAGLSAAQNQREAAVANIQQAQGHFEQSRPVAQQVNAAQAQAQLAHARVATAQAALAAAQLSLSYTKIAAPADGLASKLAIHPGSYVNVGQPIVQIVPEKTYVVANFKETQMKSMRPGQKASIKVDALGGQEFDGHVESVSGGTGATFSLLPPDNASGNFVKVVQRIPVRVAWNGPPANVVPAGSSVEVTVFTK